MENRTFKVVKFNPKTNKQEQKRIYTSEKDYLRYKNNLITRYKYYSNVKCFELIDCKWNLIESYQFDEII